MSDTQRILARVCEAIEEKKGENLLILDISKISSIADFFVFCHGTNPKQVQAISESVREVLAKEFQLRPAHVEGQENAEWILIDFLDFVVHVFSEPVREFYNLEKLWGDGTQVNPRAVTA